MRTTEALTYRIHAIKNKSIVSLIKYISTETWNRIGYVHKFNKSNRMRIHEVTLTENMLYEIHKIASEIGQSILKIEESVDEAANGNDIELSLHFPQGYLTFPIQAKLLTPYANKKNGSYYYYNHEVGGISQLKLLNAYAKKLKSYVAFYLFYNHVEECQFVVSKDKAHLHGCSIASTEALSRCSFSTNRPKFTETHPPALPFHELFEPPNQNGRGGRNPPTNPSPSPSKFNEVIDFYALFGKTINEKFVATKLKFRTSQEIQNLANWIPFGSKVETTEKKKNKNSRREATYNPKYHIILEAKPNSDLEEKSSEIPVSVKSKIPKFEYAEVEA